MAVPPSPTPRLARQLAEQEASLAGQNLVGPEHLLVALASRDLEDGPTALGTFGLTSNQLRIAVHELSDQWMAHPIGRLGFGVLTERALYNAELFAASESSPVTQRHLVAGVLSVDSQNVTRVLTKLGTSAGAIQRVLGLGPVPVPNRPAPQPNQQTRPAGLGLEGATVGAAPTRAEVAAASPAGLAMRLDDLNERIDQLTNLVEYLLAN